MTETSPEASRLVRGRADLRNRKRRDQEPLEDKLELKRLAEDIRRHRYRRSRHLVLADNELVE